MKIKTLLVDDEPRARNTVRTFIDKFIDDVEVIGEAVSVESGIEAIERLKPDLVLLDIDLQVGTGFDLLESFETITFEVIFITAFDEYAINAFRFSAVDYLLKPVKISELREAIERVKEKLKKPVEKMNFKVLTESVKIGNGFQKMVIPTTSGFEVLNIKDIVRFQSARNYTEIFMANNKKIVVSKTMKKFEALFSKIGFIRIHRSHLINPDHVVRFIKRFGGEVEMTDGAILPVSPDKKPLLIGQFFSIRQ
ncbi:MAG: LytTR family DNA-binding domain-containing protein [Bacteroidota bacterium]